jgi:hypothetical protein
VSETFVRKLHLRRNYNEEPTLCMVEIEVNIDAIALYMGTRAFRNKSKSSRYAHVKVKVRPCTQSGDKQ